VERFPLILVHYNIISAPSAFSEQQGRRLSTKLKGARGWVSKKLIQKEDYRLLMKFFSKSDTNFFESPSF
jgi:hypothetical protein